MPTQVKHLYGAPLKDRLLAFSTNRLCWKSLPETNTLAYYVNSKIRDVKSFTTLAPGGQYYKKHSPYLGMFVIS
jgi:hypothetical protein